ncbi:hypothetical protein DOTSEDRAFT_139523, partial [Dothistroma septosporum NZE10]
QKMAVVGLGGIGKTQAVLHCTYSVLDEQPDVSVFWVPVLSAETFERAYEEIAGLLKISLRAEGEGDVKKLVQRHLSKGEAGKWLMIVDNADSMQVIDAVREFLPISELGATVFTTRYSEIAHRVSWERHAVHNEPATTKELLIELDYLPLALTQAIAYMNVKKIPLSKYLDLLQGTEKDKVRTLAKDMGDLNRYDQVPSAVAKTWLVSFQQLDKEDKDAADLLRFMSCIEWKMIPHSILPFKGSDGQMTDAIGTLISYSFIAPGSALGTGEEMYDMHRLVHVAARVWVQEEGMMDEVHKQALEHLYEIFPSDAWENREGWRNYMPHAARVWTYEGEKQSEIWAKICIKVGRCLQIDGRTRDAVSWLEESRERTLNLFEEKSVRLFAQHELAGTYLANGQVKEAVQLLEQVVAIRDRVLAEDHPDRLASQHELCRAYKANGQVKKAVQILEQVVAIRSRVLAEDHPDWLASQHELAGTYLSIEPVEHWQVEKAVRLLEQVVAIRNRVLAEDHPYRLGSQYELAKAYLSIGPVEHQQVEKAIGLLEHVVAVENQVLAEDHPDRLGSKHELARAYLLIEPVEHWQVEKAVRLLEQVVAIRNRVLAEGHPHRLGSKRLLRRARKEQAKLNLQDTGGNVIVEHKEPLLQTRLEAGRANDSNNDNFICSAADDVAEDAVELTPRAVATTTEDGPVSDAVHPTSTPAETSRLQTRKMYRSKLPLRKQKT